MLPFIPILLSCFLFSVIRGQNVAINATGAAADPSAMLDISSKDKGVLVPRMLAAERIILPSPVKGLLVYQTDGDQGFYYYDGTQWTNIVRAGTGSLNYIPKFAAANSLGNSQIFDNGLSVGVGTAAPSSMSKLHVSGVGQYGGLPYYQSTVTIDGGGSSASLSGLYAEGGWRGVYGRNPGTAGGAEAIGVLGRIEGSNYSANGYAVKGEAVATGPTNIAIAGFVTGTGIAGKFDGGTSGYGVIVPNGVSGFGTNIPTTMARVNIAGVGTYGGLPFYQAGLAATGGGSNANASGVYAEGGWRGVYGRNPGTAPGTEAIGVEGRTEGGSYTASGFGLKGSVIGTGPKNFGVYGLASGGTINNYGVYGTATGTGAFAGYFSGNVHITGTISKGAGTFKIDHPLDPENKYLVHSFVESPDMMNIYNGNIVTDNNGEATVVLPGYFEALNKDFRYQLTVIGSFAQSMVAEKLNHNQFKIKTDKPNVEVSWQITGIRHDKFAEKHPVIVEVEKEPENKGYYLHAEELGKPASKSIDHRQRMQKEQEGNQAH